MGQDAVQMLHERFRRNSDEWYRVFSAESPTLGARHDTTEASGLLLRGKNIKYYIHASFFESFEKIPPRAVSVIAW